MKFISVIVIAAFFFFGCVQPLTHLSSCGTISSPGDYVLTQNVNSSSSCFNIAANNVTLDCAGHTITGPGNSGSGISLNNKSGVTIKNCVVKKFQDGISLQSSSNNLFYNNTINSNYNNGISLRSSSNNLLFNNTVSSNFRGIQLDSNSNNNFLSNNSIRSNNLVGIYLRYGDNNNAIYNNNASSNGVSGIELEHSNNNNAIYNNIVSSNSHYGIIIGYNSSNNALSGNTVSSNYNIGIYLIYNSNNTLTNNTVNSSIGEGIRLWGTSNDFLYNNTVSSSREGILIISASNFLTTNNNIIYNNMIRSNSTGISFFSQLNSFSSNNNTIYNNTIISNTIGIGLYQGYGLNNHFFNNIVNAFTSVSVDSKPNFWNTSKQLSTNILGGPFLGGNFWANPTGTGFSQTCTDANLDGICDMSLVFNSNNTDFLPLTFVQPRCLTNGLTCQNNLTNGRCCTGLVCSNSTNTCEKPTNVTSPSNQTTFNQTTSNQTTNESIKCVPNGQGCVPTQPFGGCCQTPINLICDNLTLTCTTPSNLTVENQTTINQTNQSCVSDGQQCSDLSPCCSGLSCNAASGLCTTPEKPLCIESGQKCQAGSPCCSGLACDNLTNLCSTPEPKCVQVDQKCITDSPNGGCCSGLACDAASGLCEKPSIECIQSAQQCNTDLPNGGCCSGSCTADTKWFCP